MISTDAAEGESQWRMDKSPMPYLAFFDIILVEMLGFFVRASQWWKSRLPTQSLLASFGLRPQFFLLWLAGIKQLLSKSYFALLSFPFPCPLARESGFLKNFFFCLLVPIGVSELLTSSFQIRNTRGSGIHHCHFSNLEVSSQLALYSLLMFVLY